MNHIANLRAAAAQGTPFFTCNAPRDELIAAADYIENLEVQLTRLLLKEMEYKPEKAERAKTCSQTSTSASDSQERE